MDELTNPLPCCAGARKPTLALWWWHCPNHQANTTAVHVGVMENLSEHVFMRVWGPFDGLLVPRDYVVDMVDWFHRQLLEAPPTDG
jgi:hypothetical protein